MQRPTSTTRTPSMQRQRQATMNSDHLSFVVRAKAWKQRACETFCDRPARLAAQVHGQRAAIVQVQQQPDTITLVHLWMWPHH